jgi:hypothetical protein
MRAMRRRRKHAGQKHNRALKALAAGAAIAAGTQAYAAPVRFDNPPPGEPNHFEWGTNPVYAYYNALYIQLPPEQQGNQNYPGEYGGFQRGPRSFSRTAEWNYYGWHPGWVVAGWFWEGSPNADIQTDTGSYGNAWGFASGEMIPNPSALWDHTFYGGSQGKIRDPNTNFSLIPEGVPAYLGVRISNLAGGAGWHYGWIGVLRTGGNLAAFAWGYETELGTPVAAGIPEPGSLALLALGAAAVVARRR